MAKEGKTHPLISVIIVNYNGWQYLGNIFDECINSVLESDYPNIEIVLVDNGSIDGSVEHLKARFQHNQKVKFKKLFENCGFVKGNNEGIKISNGEIILLLNNDTFVPRRTISRMAEILLSDKGIGVIGPRLLNSNGGLQSDGHAFPTRHNLLYIVSYPRWVFTVSKEFTCFEGIKHVEWVTGAALMTKKSIINKVGLLDEDYWAYSEEVDFCYKVKKAGYEVVCCTDAPIMHYGGKTSEHYSRWMNDLMERNELLFYLKNFSSLQLLGLLMLNNISILLHLMTAFIVRDYRNIQTALSELRAYLYIRRKASLPY